MKKIFLLLIGIACFTTTYSQKKDITLEEIWKENQFYPKSVRGFNSMNDGEHYSTMERVEDGQEIMVHLVCGIRTINIEFYIAIDPCLHFK